MEAVMALELAQLESQTTSTPQAEAEPGNEDVDFEPNGTVILSTTDNVLLRPRADEKDVFESDFETTDEEEGDEEHDSIAERYVQEEERRIMRVCISKYRPPRHLTMITTVLRDRKRSWSG